MAVEPITVGLGERTFSFVMDLDPAQRSDNALRQYMKAGTPPEPEVVGFMMRYIKPGDTVIDAGANIGFFTLLMSKLVGPTGTVLSIEPGANNLEALRRNIALNDCQNVALVDRALWSSNGNQGMFLYDDGGYNSFWPESDKDVLTMVQTTTLDMLCEHYFPSFMKMDIEGAEYEAMLGAKTLLSNDHFPIICEVNTDALKRAGHTAEDLLDLFRQELYDCYVLHESGQLPSSVPDGIAIVPVKQNANVLFAETNHLRRGWEEVKI